MKVKDYLIIIGLILLLAVLVEIPEQGSTLNLIIK